LHRQFAKTGIDIEVLPVKVSDRISHQDAKQHCGLEECQARSENKLYFHFNMALSSVSVAKAAVWLSLPKRKREAFSMRNIKLMYYNKIVTERIFSNLALDLNCKKIKRLYDQCLDIGRLAA
jgi:hypothetical protein